MGTKIWFLLTLVAIVQSKDLSEGSDDFGTNNTKIFDENKKANPAIWRQVDNVTITGEDGTKINKILVTDLREEKDGEAKIVEGGIGQRNVTIELKSPTALRGYDFHIEVYANSDSQASASHDASKQESNPAKPSDEKKPINAVPIVPISLIRDELPSTAGQDSLKENKRQNRDAEDKDKLNKQLNPHYFTDITTEVPELKSTGVPSTNKDKREDKVPEQGITNHHIHLQEAPKMPESTARSIPTTEIKISEEKHNHQETRNIDENKKQTNFDTNKKQMSVNYSQFNVREVTPNVPVNAQSPAEEVHKRHARDVNQNTPAVETTEHPLPPAVSRNQGSTTTKVPSDATHIGNSPAVLKEDKQSKEHVQVDKVEETIQEHHNDNHRFSGRYIPDRFARNPNLASKRETSTEIDKVSTIAPTNVNSAQSSTPIIPRIIANDQTTTKPETTTGKQVDSDINSELHINTNKKIASEEITANKRITRDTADKNNKEQPSVLPNGNIKDSPTSTTLKPELIGFKAPVEASEKDKEIKHETPKADNSENKDKQRNIRGTEDNKENINGLSISTTKPDNEESNEKVSTDKTPVQVPIQLKSTQEVKTQPKDAPKEKERIARDVDIKKSHNDEKSSSTTDATGIEIEKGKKSNEKVTVEYQSLMSTIKDNKKEEKAPTIAPSNENKTEINPKIGENVTQNGDLKNLPGKFTRQIKNIEETSTIEQQNNKNGLSTTNTPLIDTTKAKVEPKQPEKSLVPPQ